MGSGAEAAPQKKKSQTLKKRNLSHFDSSMCVPAVWTVPQEQSDERPHLPHHRHQLRWGVPLCRLSCQAAAVPGSPAAWRPQVKLLTAAALSFPHILHSRMQQGCKSAGSMHCRRRTICVCRRNYISHAQVAAWAQARSQHYLCARFRAVLNIQAPGSCLLPSAELRSSRTCANDQPCGCKNGSCAWQGAGSWGGSEGV